MILITGSNGQLGNELKILLEESLAFFAPHEICDITNYDQCENIILQNKITHIINCAGYTFVDKAETEPVTAFMINESGVRNLAELSKKHSITLIHISTDYVFELPSNTPIVETHSPNPTSIYGKSKLAGEEAIILINPTAIIIRTSWLYSVLTLSSSNFVKKIILFATERKNLNIVYDQIGTPTNAADLAQVILKILPLIKKNTCEIYNYSNEGAISWYDFAKAVCEIKKIKINLIPIESFEHVTPVSRPFYSVLNKRKIKEKFNITIPYWRESLKKSLEQL